MQKEMNYTVIRNECHDNCSALDYLYVELYLFVFSFFDLSKFKMILSKYAHAHSNIKR